ncbi:MAG TPA: glutaredoxin domain-containing protein [Ktedonobacterales bacterium]|jgi:mycoredoxin
MTQSYPFGRRAELATTTLDRSLAEPPNEEILFYATRWCGDCQRAKRVFAELGVPYTYVDIEHDAAARARVMELNDGLRSVPTIVFPDGGVLVEPSNRELLARLAPYVGS